MFWIRICIRMFFGLYFFCILEATDKKSMIRNRIRTRNPVYGSKDHDPCKNVTHPEHCFTHTGMYTHYPLVSTRTLLWTTCVSDLETLKWVRLNNALQCVILYVKKVFWLWYTGFGEKKDNTWLSKASLWIQMLTCLPINYVNIALKFIQCCGSGIRCLFYPRSEIWIRFFRILNLGSRSQTYIFESFYEFFG